MKAKWWKQNRLDVIYAEWEKRLILRPPKPITSLHWKIFYRGLRQQQKSNLVRCEDGIWVAFAK